jgi:hypothetical protein
MASAHVLRRIVCLQPSATVILAAIDALDCVVAWTESPIWIRKLCVSGAILADSWTANTEQIVATRPRSCDRLRSLSGRRGHPDSQIRRALVFAIHRDVFQGSNSVSTKGIRQITAVLDPQLKNSPA